MTEVTTDPLLTANFAAQAAREGERLRDHLIRFTCNRLEEWRRGLQDEHEGLRARVGEVLIRGGGVKNVPVKGTISVRHKGQDVLRLELTYGYEEQSGVTPVLQKVKAVTRYSVQDIAPAALPGRLADLRACALVDRSLPRDSQPLPPLLL